MIPAYVQLAVHSAVRKGAPERAEEYLLSVLEEDYAELATLRRQRQQAIDRAKRHQERAKSEGRCTVCGKKSKTPRCKKCSDRCNAASRRSKEKRKEAGLCQHCPNKHLPDRVLCAECNEKQKSYQRRRYQKKGKVL